MGGDSCGDEFWGADFGFGVRPKRRRARMFAGGEMRLALLHLIGQESRHGYDLIKGIEKLTGGAYAPSPGAVYPTLALMLDEGVIKGAPPDGARKSFEIAHEGTSELEVRSGEVIALFAKLTQHSKAQQQSAAPELFRAMGNMSNVLRNRARAGELDAAAVQKTVDMIDDVAKRIERL